MADISPTGLLSFPHLFTPRAPVPGAEERYSAVLIFDAEAQKTPEYKAMRAAAGAAARAEFGDKMPKNMRSPFRDASEKEYAGYEPGCTFVQFWTKQKPGIVDARLQEILAPDDVWPGQLARVSYKAFAYNVSGNAGVSFGLNNIQIIKKDMPRLDGRMAANKEFDAVDGGGDDNGGDAADDDIPF